MVDLKAKPYCLSDEDIEWVEKTIAGMSDEEKVGQLFFDNQGQASDDELREMIKKYHLGGFRYNGIPSDRVQQEVRVLQTTSPIPLFVACNTEAGGNGTGTDGDYIGSALKIGATGNPEYAFDLGYLSNEEGAVMGNNMAFAPVADILYNWENTEVVQRVFGDNPEQVTEMCLGYLRGVHDLPGYASVAKHFPGNGQDFRDAHLSNNVNYFGKKKWMETYGKVYKALIDAGVDGIMGGHIMMPNYMREVNPDITDAEMLPATLEPAIMTGLLRDELGFNGIVVSDATHMVGMTSRMPREEMVPAAINAGCDMFLFFNDQEEDFNTMLQAYKTGKISEERMNEALTRILGLKAHMGLNKTPGKDLVPPPEALAGTLGKKEYKEAATEIADNAITLVKYLDKDVLPITPEKYKKIMIVEIKGNDGAFRKFLKAAFGMGDEGKKETPGQKLCNKLIERGFDAFIYESPIDKMQKMIDAGEDVSNINIYRMGKNAVADFKDQQDLVITLFNVEEGRPAWGFSKGGGEIPWYANEKDLTTIGISLSTPTMLADAPMLRTYINAYDAEDYTLDALVNKLMTGPEAFTGKDPIDSFCGLFDTKI